MKSKGTTSYRINDQNALYFITFSIVGWIDILTKEIYKDILIDSLKYCQKNKGLELYGYVIMTNHIHLIIRASDNYKLSEILRDFKKHTSKKIIKTIQEGNESRKDWLIGLFKEFGRKNPKNEEFQVWRNDNHPIELFSPVIIDQKLEYIHNNPVEAGYVDKPEDYIYSSARNYAELEAPIEILYL